MAGNPSTNNEGTSNSGTTVPATPPGSGSGTGAAAAGGSPPSDQSFHHFRYGWIHESLDSTIKLTGVKFCHDTDFLIHYLSHDLNPLKSIQRRPIYKTPDSKSLT